MSTAIVFGGGIGGLTAGLALAARGWEVTVLEQAPELRPVGLALIVGPNAQRALGVVDPGIVEAIHSLAAISGDGGLRNARGQWLSRDSAELALERWGHPIVLVTRAALVDLLATRLPAGALRLDTVVTRVDATAGRVVLADGEVLTADLVVAADGIHSATRRELWHGHPEPAFIGKTGWQMFAPAEGLDVAPGISWAGGEFGAMPLADGRLYVFAEVASPTRPPLPQEAELAELKRRFGRLPSPIPEVLDRVDVDSILRHDVHSMTVPLPALHTGRVAILGDAAHAMAPNLGQGACQAIEDAVTLAHYVATVPSLGDALAAYTADRLPRVAAIVKRSHTVARLATLQGTVPQALRNGFLRALGLLGPSAVLRQADLAYSWVPPGERVREVLR